MLTLRAGIEKGPDAPADTVAAGPAARREIEVTAASFADATALVDVEMERDWAGWREVYLVVSAVAGQSSSSS